MKFGSTISISHPNFQDVWILGVDSYEVKYQGYDGEVSIDISDDGGLTWNHIMNYLPPESEQTESQTAMHVCQPMIDGSPSEYARLRISAIGDPSISGISDFFKTPYGDGTY